MKKKTEISANNRFFFKLFIPLNTHSGLDSGVKLDMSSDVGTSETNKKVKNVTVMFD